MSSYESAAEQVKTVAARIAPSHKITIQPPYYDALDYIAALVASAKDYLAGGYDHLLFSFPWHSRTAFEKVRPDRLPLSGEGQLLRRFQPGARDLLSGAMFQNGGGVCGTLAGVPPGKIFRLLPIAPGQRPVAETIHGF